MNNSKKSPLATIAVAAIVLAGAAGGAAIYMTKDKAAEPAAPEMAAETPAPAPEQVATSAGEVNPAPAAPAPEAAPAPASKEEAGKIGGVAVKPGNPVVAKVNGKDVSRMDVFQFIQQLPPNIQQMPPAQVYPMALDNVVNATLVQAKADSAGLDADPEVQKQLQAAKEQIVRAVYLQKQVDAKVTDDKMKKVYDEAMAKTPDVEERKARHILVETEDKAKEIIGKLKAGADFAELAKAESKDPSAAKNAGDLGWFLKDQMVPEFANAAFAANKGELLDAPVKTQFGWHVVKVEDSRAKTKPSFEELKPQLAAEVRRLELEKLVAEWRKEADVTVFDVNGDPVAPSSGTEAAPAAPAPAPAQ
jgi:peptidyl-prolyl cis-trans isomerase C